MRKPLRWRLTRYDAHFDLLGQLVPGALFPWAVGGTLGGLAPGLQAVVVAEPLAPAHVLGALLMQAQDGVDAACFEFGHQGVGAEAGVPDQHVAFVQQMAQLLPEA